MPTPSFSFDVIVAGLGAMGSAAAFHLAKSGMRTLGLDRFTPPHAYGSSHGQTRIIREAYFEDPSYVPLIQRAYTLWHELETLTERKLYQSTGGLMIGRPEGPLVRGARQSAETHHLKFEMLASSEIRKRFPALHPDPDMVGVWEPRAGILFPEECLAAHLDQARRHGAVLEFEESIESWLADDEGVTVRTGQGSYHASQLVLALGSWLPFFWPDCLLHLTVERQVQFWFAASNRSAFQKDRCPVNIWEHAPGRFFYGFPDLGSGVKVARHHEGISTEPDSLDRRVRIEEIESMRQITRPFLPGLDGEVLNTAVCMYTNTPDGHFLIDRHPQQPRVVVASPCSGHGFKFSSVIGEIVSALVRGEEPPFDINLFRWRK